MNTPLAAELLAAAGADLQELADVKRKHQRVNRHCVGPVQAPAIRI
jgi:hypothetical protein